jgi:hypothetical protein
VNILQEPYFYGSFLVKSPPEVPMLLKTKSLVFFFLGLFGVAYNANSKPCDADSGMIVRELPFENAARGTQDWTKT